MTGSSGDIRKSEPDPLVDKTSPHSKGSSWKLVLASLVGLPLLFSLVLSQWLGTPREGFDSSYVFAQIGVPEVATVSLDSLVYGNMLFARLAMGEESRKTFLRSLAAFQASHGKTDKPISLKLEREWWNPPDDRDGTCWKRGNVTVWSPDNQPEIFYTVVEQVP